MPFHKNPLLFGSQFIQIEAVNQSSLQKLFFVMTHTRLNEKIIVIREKTNGNENNPLNIRKNCI